MPKQPDESRVPPAVGAIPLFGELVKNVDAQARWMQEMVEQNARLVGQLPETMKAFNDSLQRFNDTVGRLDRAVTRIESTTRRLTGPIDRAVRLLDRKSVQDLPATLDELRAEAADTQRSVVALQSTVDRMVGMFAELPGAGIVRRLTRGRSGGDAASGADAPRDAG